MLTFFVLFVFVCLFFFCCCCFFPKNFVFLEFNNCVGKFYKNKHKNLFTKKKKQFTRAVFTSTSVYKFWKKKRNLPFDDLTVKGLFKDQKRNNVSFSFLLIKALCPWNFVIYVTPTTCKKIKISSISPIQNGNKDICLHSTLKCDKNTLWADIFFYPFDPCKEDHMSIHRYDLHLIMFIKVNQRLTFQ